MAPTLVWVCPFVALWFYPFFPDFRTFNYISRVTRYMHIITMRRLKLCALFVVSAYISRVITANVRKMAKMEI